MMKTIRTSTRLTQQYEDDESKDEEYADDYYEEDIGNEKDKLTENEIKSYIDIPDVGAILIHDCEISANIYFIV